jgi:dipeptidyl aminopeptidase/acylaminoacyl peptidase
VTDAALLRELSPLHRADRITAPLLVVHGANDTNVPLGEAEQIVAALRARGGRRGCSCSRARGTRCGA